MLSVTVNEFVNKSMQIQYGISWDLAIECCIKIWVIIQYY